MQEAAFRVGAGQGQGPAECGASLVGPAEAAQQLAAGGVPVLVTVEVERVDERKRRPGTVGRGCSSAGSASTAPGIEPGGDTLG